MFPLSKRSIIRKIHAFHTLFLDTSNFQEPCLSTRRRKTPTRHKNSTSKTEVTSEVVSELSRGEQRREERKKEGEKKKQMRKMRRPVRRAIRLRSRCWRSFSSAWQSRNEAIIWPATPARTRIHSALWWNKVSLSLSLSFSLFLLFFFE